jgi:response regulator RpfG family c-di-GMP phosphodiesterase
MEAQPRILVVDDEQPILASLRRLLAFEPWEVMTTDNSARALEVLAAGNIAVVMSDQHMPGLEGVELLRRARDLAPDTSRILFSGHIDIDLLRAAVNGGEVYRFVTKPWDNDEVLVAIRQGIERWHLLWQNRQLREQTERQNEQLRRFNRTLEDLVAARTADLAHRTHDLDLRNRALVLSQEVLDRLPVAVLGIDPEGMLALANQLALAAFPGIAPGERPELPAELLGAGPPRIVVSALGPLHCETLTLMDGDRSRGKVITGMPVAPVVGDEP